jgi:hypothetical protein
MGGIFHLSTGHQRALCESYYNVGDQLKVTCKDRDIMYTRGGTNLRPDPRVSCEFD